jgi:hypothetical protein
LTQRRTDSLENQQGPLNKGFLQTIWNSVRKQAQAVQTAATKSRQA